MVRRLLVGAGGVVWAAVVACGGNVVDTGPSAGGSAGVGGANAGSGGRGGSSSGSGGTTAGSGGTTSSPFENCVSACDRALELQCPAGFDHPECLKSCAASGTRGEPCDSAYAEMYACFANANPTPWKCDGTGTTIKCLPGPCDDATAALSTQCGQIILCRL